VIPLAALCLAGEFRTGDASSVQQFFAPHSAQRESSPNNVLYQRNESAATAE
jgi:hypothetical protein